LLFGMGKSSRNPLLPKLRRNTELWLALGGLPSGKAQLMECELTRTAPRVAPAPQTGHKTSRAAMARAGMSRAPVPIQHDFRWGGAPGPRLSLLPELLTGEGKDMVPETPPTPIPLKSCWTGTHLWQTPQLGRPFVVGHRGAEWRCVDFGLGAGCRRTWVSS
jgi:hypothetical protein